MPANTKRTHKPAGVAKADPHGARSPARRRKKWMDKPPTVVATGVAKVAVLQPLLLHVLCHGTNPPQAPSGIKVTNRFGIGCVVMLAVRGGVGRPGPEFSRALLKPASSPVYEVVAGVKETGSGAADKTAPSIGSLAASPDEMVANEYPAEGIHTTDLPHEPSTWALDCEMCLSASGPVLARVCLLDHTGAVVVDELVQPDVPITDHLTQFLGITPEMLSGVTTTRTQVVERLLQIVSARDVVVGHALEHDLAALGMVHRLVVDTALLYEHVLGPPAKSSLRYLAKVHLDRTIQASDEGHSPVEDAATALDLVHLWMENYNRLLPRADCLQGRSRTNSVFRRLKAQHGPNNNPVLLCVVKQLGNQTGFYHAAAAPDRRVACDNDAAATKAVIEALADAQFVFGELGSGAPALEILLAMPPGGLLVVVPDYAKSKTSAPAACDMYFCIKQ